jgi:hypothetical protein
MIFQKAGGGLGVLQPAVAFGHAALLLPVCNGLGGILRR